MRNTIAFAILILMLLASPWQSALAADPCADGNLRPVKIEGETLQLSWIGTVTEKMAAKLDAAFEAHKRSTKAVELSLQSCGGRVDYMSETIAVLRNIKTTHQLTTIVDRGATCASACIPIFLASDRRRAAMSSLWFFHRSWRYQLSGGIDAVQTSVPGTHSLQRFLDRYYAPAGVSSVWLARVKGIIDNNGGYWQTGRELWDDKSGVITETIGDVQPQEFRPIYIAPAPGCTAMCRG